VVQKIKEKGGKRKVVQKIKEKVGKRKVKMTPREIVFLFSLLIFTFSFVMEVTQR
jgi:hypothetical protein